MIKTIYDEALLKLREIAEKLTHKQWIELTNNIELIRNNLQQAQKQEKLLKLYREYFMLDNIPIIISHRPLYNKFLELRKQIKELENNEN